MGDADLPLVNQTPGEIALALKEACQFNTPTAVISPEEYAAFRGKYIDLTDDLLVIEVFSRQEYIPFRPLSYCFVSLSHQTRIGVFIARVVSSEFKDDRHILLVEPPIQVCAVEARKSFRITVPPRSGLKAAVRVKGGEPVRVRVVDLSLAGAQIAFTKKTMPKLKVGSTIDLAMTLGPVRLEVQADVKRLVGPQCGLFFPKFMDDEGHLVPNDAMISILRQLEQVWLKRKPSRRARRRRRRRTSSLSRIDATGCSRAQGEAVRPMPGARARARAR